MGTEKTPLVQKLILGVLTLILGCLVVLIAQNRSKQTVAIPEAHTTEEPAAAPTAVESAQPPPQPKPGETAPPPRSAQVVPQAAPPVVAQAAADTAIAQPQATLAQPYTYTTLVNPVGRAPVEIVVRPEAVLKTQLCGRVRLEGRPPPEIPISMDATCNQLHDKPVTTRHYVVGPNGGLANVLVYIKEGLPSGYSSPPSTNPVMTAVGCLFEPYVMGVQTGQKFSIFNSDSVLHNVHATARNNRDFNIALGLRGRTVMKTFDHAEVFVRFKCDVHPWEFSYLGVVPHEFFSVTDTNGVFCLPAGLPHGRYVLAAAHPKAGETLQQIVVQEDNPKPLEFAFTVRPR